MTLEDFNQIPDGEIFATGLLPNSPEGIFMTDTHQGENLKWIAVKGYGYDWAIYCSWDYFTEDYIKQNGQKVGLKSNIQKCVPCDDNVYDLYRI